MENLKQIGTRVRGIRTEANYSVEQMASALGIAPAEYISYENGSTEAPFSFFYKLAEIFNIEISSVLSGETSNLNSYTITRSGEGFSLARRPGFSYLHQAIHMKDREGEPFIITAPYGGENPEMKFSTHSGQEFDLVLSGKLKVQVGTHTEILEEGDSIYYNSSTPHGMIAVDGKDCVFCAVVMSGDETAEPVVRKSIMSAKKSEKLICEKFVETTENENGELVDIKFKNTDTFNFGFDIVDGIAEKYPDLIDWKEIICCYYNDDILTRDFFEKYKEYIPASAFKDSHLWNNIVADIRKGIERKLRSCE